MRVTNLKGWKAAAARVALGGVVGATLLAGAVPGVAAQPLSGVDLERLDPAVARLLAKLAVVPSEEPGDAAGWAGLALGCEANELWGPARESWAEALRLRPDEELWRLHAAIVELRDGDAVAARESLRALVADSPGLPPAVQRLAIALRDAGDLEGSLRAFARLAELLPRAPEGPAGQGEVLLLLGRPEEAAERLEAAVRLDPRFGSAHHLLGLAYHRLGQSAEAGLELARGAGSQPRLLPDDLSPRLEELAVHPTERISRAGRLLASGQPDRAAELLNLVLADHPNNLSALNNLAIAHLRQGELDAARQLLDRALAVNDRKFSTYLNLVSWAQRSGRADEALAFAETAVGLGPRIPDTHLTLARVLAVAGRMPEATASLAAAVELGLRDPRAQLELAAQERRLGNRSAAAEHYRRAAEIWPWLAPAWIGLGEVSLEMGATEEVAAALDHARALAPEDPRVRELDRRLAESWPPQNR